MNERTFKAEIAKCNKRITRIEELLAELAPDTGAYERLVKRRTEWLRYRAALTTAKSKQPDTWVWGASEEI